MNVDNKILLGEGKEEEDRLVPDNDAHIVLDCDSRRVLRHIHSDSNNFSNRNNPLHIGSNTLWRFHPSE